MAGAFGRPELAQGLGFDLANALAGYVKFHIQYLFGDCPGLSETLSSRVKQ
jgi:hypothetical protein